MRVSHQGLVTDFTKVAMRAKLLAVRLNTLRYWPRAQIACAILCKNCSSNRADVSIGCTKTGAMCAQASTSAFPIGWGVHALVQREVMRITSANIMKTTTSAKT